MTPSRCLGVVAGLMTIVGVAQAEPYPTGVVKIISMHPPGSVTDVLARPLAQALNASLVTLAKAHDDEMIFLSEELARLARQRLPILAVATVVGILAAYGLAMLVVRRTLLQYGRTKGVIHDLIAEHLAVDEKIVADPESIVVTVGRPSVNVPVLSTTSVSTRARSSSASAFLISTPACAPRPVPTMIAIGVASPSAHGQAMISTATALTSACASRGSGPQSDHPANATAATPTTAGTNHSATRSASR